MHNTFNTWCSFANLILKKKDTCLGDLVSYKEIYDYMEKINCSSVTLSLKKKKYPGLSLSQRERHFLIQSLTACIVMKQRIRKQNPPPILWKALQAAHF